MRRRIKMGYVPTGDWKVLAAKRIVSHPMTAKGYPVPLVVLHHTVTTEGPFFKILQSVDRYHQGGVYDDIAYNGAASNTEEFYTDLRGPLVQGGATGKWNGEIIDRRSLSIVVPGDFQTAGKDAPNAVVVDTVAALIVRWILQGHVTRTFKLEPHRNYHRTSCCGERLMAVIPAIRARVDELLAGGVSLVSNVEEDMMGVPIREWNTEYIRGASGSEYSAAVELWQRALLAAGFDPGAVDGLRGAKTEAANKWFESRFGLDNPDGFPGNPSWRRLLAILATPSTEVEVPAGIPVEVAPAIQRIRKAANDLDELLNT
jgi:hypothetical protein